MAPVTAIPDELCNQSSNKLSSDSCNQAHIVKFGLAWVALDMTKGSSVAGATCLVRYRAIVSMFPGELPEDCQVVQVEDTLKGLYQLPASGL